MGNLLRLLTGGNDDSKDIFLDFESKTFFISSVLFHICIAL